MAGKAFICPNCDGVITEYDSRTGTGTCPYCGALVTDPAFVAAPDPATPVQQVNVVAPAQTVYVASAAPVSRHNDRVALILCYVLGVLGVHRFYVGKIGTGLIWMFTGGCVLVGWVIDAISIASGNFTDAQGYPLVNANTRIDSSSSQRHVCANCGSPLSANDMVCKNCGSHIKGWWETAWGALVIIAVIIVVALVYNGVSKAIGQ